MLATNSTNATIKMKTLCVISAVCLLASFVSQAQGAVQPLTLDQEVTQTGRVAVLVPCAVAPSSSLCLSRCVPSYNCKRRA